MSGWKVLIASLWLAIAAAFALLARASAFVPFGEPLHSYYEHKADLAALGVFAIGSAPILLLIFADVLWHRLIR